jgi:hypothetical protein
MVERGTGTAELPRYTPSLGTRSLQVLACVMVYIVVGPVVGTITIAILKGLTDGSLYGLAQIPGSILLGLVTGTSHAIGGIPAAIAGLLVGIKQAFGGGAGWRFAICIGVLVGIPLAFLFPVAMLGVAKVLGEFCIVTTLATLACWRITRSWFDGPKVTT